jgi:RimJ/RimL family protein N-acetyltransferase
MKTMADPMDALRSMQQALIDGTPLYLGNVGGDYQGRLDQYPNGDRRYLFAKIVNGKAIALVIFATEESINGVDCYSVGYAVDEKYRRRGLAVEAFQTGVVELVKELRKTGLKRFYVDAVIDVTNEPSIKFAQKLFAEPGQKIHERESERPALHFKRLVSI